MADRLVTANIRFEFARFARPRSSEPLGGFKCEEARVNRSKGSLWSTLWSLNAADKIAAAAWITAIIALVGSSWQFWDQRRHERLSVAPLLALHFVDINDQGFFGIVIRNDGFGPARVRNLRLFVDGKRVAVATSPEDWQNVFLALGVDRPPIATLSVYEGATIRAGENIRVFGVLRKDLTAQTEAIIRQAGRRLNLSGCYCSLYDECQSLRSPQLKDEPCGA